MYFEFKGTNSCPKTWLISPKTETSLLVYADEVCHHKPIRRHEKYYNKTLRFPKMYAFPISVTK